jgi:hypothetical protein
VRDTHVSESDYRAVARESADEAAAAARHYLERGGFARSGSRGLGDLVPWTTVRDGDTVRLKQGSFVTAKTYRLRNVDEVPALSERLVYRLYLTSDGKRSANPDGSTTELDRFIRECPPLRSRRPVVHEFLIQGGWSVKKAGTTGRPVGRPKRTIDVSTTRARLEAEMPGVDLGSLSFGRGRQMEKSTSEALALALAELSYPPNAIPVEAIAAVLGCKKDTVYRLRLRGAEMRKNSPKGEDTRANEVHAETYWAFRAGWKARYVERHGQAPTRFFSPIAYRNAKRIKEITDATHDARAGHPQSGELPRAA